MLDWLKSVWAKWKIHITVVGGAVVIATAYGNCTYEPASDEDEVSSTTPAEVETVQVNSTTTDNQNTDNTTDNQATDETTNDQNTGNTDNTESTD